MSPRRDSGLITGRCSHNTRKWHEMVGLILVFFLNGNSCWAFIKAVNYPPLIYAWEGSCALLKCEYDMYQTRQLKKLTWYKDPLYNNNEKKFTGTILYTQEGDKKNMNTTFMSRAQFLGDLKKDCTLRITDLLVTDSGNYSVRLEDGDDKWMSTPYLYLNVSVSPPEPRIDVPSTFIESQSATVTCSIDYSCQEVYPITLLWGGAVKEVSKAASYEESIKVLKTKNELTFLPSWEHDKKPLRCSLRSNKDPRKTSESEIMLDIKHSPKLVQVVTVGSNATVTEGGHVTLRCLVNSSNPPVTEYHWYKSYSIQAPKIPTMEITDASAMDAGNYSCRVSNSRGVYQPSQPLEVVVHFAPKKARVTKSVTENIIEGKSLTLTCTAQCYPPATGYNWYKDNHRLRNSEKDLKIQKIGADDSGYYRCEVYCPMGNASSPKEYINVMYAPKKVDISISSPDPGLIKEGDTVRLVCTYNSSNPKSSNFLWDLNRKYWQATTINEIVFERITATVAGNYSCAAKNEFGSSSSPEFLVDVKYAPKNVEVRVAPSWALQEDHFAQLKCHVGDSNPIVNRYKWFKDDHMCAELQGSELTFPRLNSSDSGNYTCEAVNIIDATKSQPVQVTVQYSPRNVVVSLDPPTWIFEDSNISLICNCDAEPEADIYTWYKMNKFHINTKGRRLHLNRITRAQAGPYQCEAKNSIASRRSDVITLAVHYSSKTIGKIVAISAGLVVFLLLIVVVLHFRLWKKLPRQKIRTGGESDDRSDTFFVVNRHQSPEDHQDELRNPAMATDPEYQESISYSSIQFPSNHVSGKTMPTRACISNRSIVTHKNTEESPIYSLLQKPCKPPQENRDAYQDGQGNTTVSLDTENEESINYSIIQFPKNHTSEEAVITRAHTNNRSSATLKSDEGSVIYSVVQKPCRPPKMKEPSIDYENVSKKTEDIEYCTIINLKCKPTNEYEWDSESDFEDMGAQYAELRH